MSKQDDGMTWAQFKQQLESQGVTDETQLLYLDCHAPMVKVIFPDDPDRTCAWVE